MSTALRVLVTAGPTAEDIDPVRFITNRSSGRMGIEVARAVARSGGTARLILGPTHLPPPDGVDVVPVRSAADMHRAVLDNLDWARALVMAAAVADYTPAERLPGKLHKQDGDLFLRLTRTTDILADIQSRPERRGKCVIGFSLDTALDLPAGRRKLDAKGLDAVVVNSTSSFGSGEEEAAILRRDGEEICGVVTKEELARKLVACIRAWPAG